MESRDAEPRDAAWSQVSEQFATLSDRLRRRYEESDVASDVAREGGADERAAGRESVQDALRTLSDAAERLVATVGSAVRDAEVQADAKRAASSLVDALGLTFSQVGADIRRRRAGAAGDGPFGRAGEDPWDDEAAPQPPKVEEIERRPEE
jgi:hypothetical protein